MCRFTQGYLPYRTRRKSWRAARTGTQRTILRIHMRQVPGDPPMDATSPPVVSSRPRTTRSAPHIYPDISGDGFQYHTSQLTVSDEWYCPQTCSPEDVGSTPGLSHSHRRVLTRALAFTGYCHCHYCMVCGICKAGSCGVVYCAIVVQTYCTIVGNASGRRQYKDD